MPWNWLSPDWPCFRFRHDLLGAREALFLRQSGVVAGTIRHLPDEQRLLLIIELLTTEALKTSAIEGEILDPKSLRSSLCRHIGLVGDPGRTGHAEEGIAEMLAAFHRCWADPLNDTTLFRWHQSLMQRRGDLREVGGDQHYEDPAQVVSAAIDAPKLHFESVASASMPAALTRFCQWFNATSPSGDRPLPALARAGLAHLYFKSVDPFDEGDGRIGRAITEKALAQAAGQASLSALSFLMERRRQEYYAEMEAVRKTLDIQAWLEWFADLLLAAQAHSLQCLDFLLANTRLLDRLRGQLNPRQEKALSHLMQAGMDGSQAGLSASKYQALTGALAATGRRDLGHLVTLGALLRTGQVKGTRYWLAHGQFAIDKDMAQRPASA